MWLELDPSELELVLGIFESAHRERLLQVHRADSVRFRSRLDREAVMIERVHDRLSEAIAAPAAMHADDAVDISAEDSFPASDPPAHGSSATSSRRSLTSHD